MQQHPHSTALQNGETSAHNQSSPHAQMTMNSGFEQAPQAHIIRSLQKDQYYLSFLHQRLEKLCTDVLGRHAARIEDEIRMVAYCCYFGLTTLLGKQTLGEEYCDIMQIDGNRRPPSRMRRLCLVVLQCLTPYMFRRISSEIRMLSVEEEDDEDQHSAPVRRRRSLRVLLYSWFVSSLRTVYPYLDSLRDLHTSLFYLFGRYLEVSKMLCGIQYLYLQRRQRGQVGYQVLGFLLGIQLTGSLLLFTTERLRTLLRTSQSSSVSSSSNTVVNNTETETATKFRGDDNTNNEEDDSDFDEKEEPKCVFCFGRRRNTTATECGHLFCWGCIISCCDRKAECPLCRQPISRQTLVRLEHYKLSKEDEDEEDIDDEVVG
mmetsp:Transcript_7197/g.9879  ORF Transcript_7197/g.9879 Transcript_7197/m.9879 type:complete len:374 (-) Transcript_7197:645-1766(-)|eukprot:CAMPEP_0185259922 /NCGR_PEP_ID=MMETSP1359-20130426/8603_1 /TAXON_ID=552665 /ORGANISM="Bigelowiella longifila, Strain CCMP242" /LENGTH=373 /DNA_ID=CAMNT_0027845993 /DNA_START=145 /DNA_END=1266 /DNA_ORIENTATION=-